VATLIEKDNFYKDRLIAARSTPEPYWELVYRYLREEREDPTPSLVAYFVALLSRHRAKFNQVLTNDRKKRGHVREPFQDIRRFGWDEEVNRNYKDPIWLLRYAGWRALRTVDMIWALVRSILMTLGLWRL
jgi:hypothetical protein